jgi:hypothetical protein
VRGGFSFLFKSVGVFYFVILHEKGGVQHIGTHSGFEVLNPGVLFIFYVTVITHFEAEDAML